MSNRKERYTAVAVAASYNNNKAYTHYKSETLDIYICIERREWVNRDERYESNIHRWCTSNANNNSLFNIFFSLSFLVPSPSKREYIRGKQHEGKNVYKEKELESDYAWSLPSIRWIGTNCCSLTLCCAPTAASAYTYKVYIYIHFGLFCRLHSSLCTFKKGDRERERERVSDRVL